MSLLIETSRAIFDSTNPRIGLARGEEDDFFRFLTIDGHRVFRAGVRCNTCWFIFERLDGPAPFKSPDSRLAARLHAGIRTLEEAPVSELAEALPAGRYQILLLEVRPILAMPGGEADYFAHEELMLWDYDDLTGMPHYPKTHYFVGDSCLFINAEDALFEFFVPLYQIRWLDGGRVDEWAEKMTHGSIPTALAISTLDYKQPATWQGDPAVTAHWCLTHYILDGHHRVFAAAREGLPLTLLSFLYLEESYIKEESLMLAVNAIPRK